MYTHCKGFYKTVQYTKVHTVIGIFSPYTILYKSI